MGLDFAALQSNDDVCAKWMEVLKRDIKRKHKLSKRGTFPTRIAGKMPVNCAHVDLTRRL